MLSFCFKGAAVIAGLAAVAVNIIKTFADQQQGARTLKAVFPLDITFAVLSIILIGLVFFAPAIYSYFRKRLSRFLIAFKSLISVTGITKVEDVNSINESLEGVGYAYDPQQDIFYSIINPWQKTFGYCRLYDEAAAPMGMIIDCEPVYFEYEGKKWLIEFWKGQYDLTTGAEIGVYNTTGPELHVPGVFNGTFYDCPNEEDYLKISYSLKKNGKTLFVRKGIHWWMTGFKLGEFSEPSELTMYINVRLKDRAMRDIFVKALNKVGYSDSEIAAYGNTVSLLFDKPRSKQPLTRTKATDALIQKKNKLLCDQYQEITNGCITLQEKLEAVQENSPNIYGHIANLGKGQQLFSVYEKIKEYLD